MNGSALLLSLQVGVMATTLAFLVGVPLAWILARGRFRGWQLRRDVISTALLLPMVLPPTVLGYALLVGLGRHSIVGGLWERATGHPVVFTRTAAVVAAFVSALPFLVRSAQGGFEQVDRVYEEAARTLGRSEWGIFLSVTGPLAWRSIVAGTALGFARAMGEFGATMMIAGNVPGRTETASVAVYDAVQAGRMADAGTMAMALAAITGAVLLVVSRVGRH